jgi:hypothetical protein
MTMTREQRVELLRLAREAKAKKKQERDAEKPKPVMGRPKKIKNKEETFEELDKEQKEKEIPEKDVEDVKMKVSDDEIDKLLDKPKTRLTYKERSQNRSLDLKLKEPKKEQDDEEEVQEEIIYKKKPKKKILRKIIYEESTDDEIEEVVIDNRKNKQVQKEAKVKKVSKPLPLNAPKDPEIKSGFNFFKY